MITLRYLAKLMPESVFPLIKMSRYARQIRTGSFRSPEKEFPNLGKWVSEGDWVLDIGANVGHYTRALSAIVGNGRVIAVEPHPKTFAYLASNTSDLFNVTLLNAAATDRVGLVGFDVPKGNFYHARITPTAANQVMGLCVGSFAFPERISFIKIDVEGHELCVLSSLASLILKDKPTLMIENHIKALKEWAEEQDYYLDDLPGSHNHILIPKKINLAVN